jgi:hypothetical protein
MIRRRRYNKGLILERSFRSYALNTALRLFVKPQFKSDTKPPRRNARIHAEIH